MRLSCIAVIVPVISNGLVLGLLNMLEALESPCVYALHTKHTLWLSEYIATPSDEPQEPHGPCLTKVLSILSYFI